MTDREEDEAARAAVLRATPACDSVHGCARGGARERAPGDGRIEPTLASYLQRDDDATRLGGGVERAVAAGDGLALLVVGW